MGITDKIAPAASNIKDSVQAAIQPFAGSVSSGKELYRTTGLSLQ